MAYSSSQEPGSIFYGIVYIDLQLDSWEKAGQDKRDNGLDWPKFMIDTF